MSEDLMTEDAAQSRQVLARYAFFEQARRTSRHPEDAMLPLILPAIAGKSGQVFSDKVLAKELEPVFGAGLVQFLAESMVTPLLREKYIKKEASIDDGVIYSYTDKVNEIPLASSISSAEKDIDEIICSLIEYIEVTKPIKAVSYSKPDLLELFIKWISTKEATNILGSPYGSGDTDEIDKSENARPILTVSSIPSNLRILFAGFVAWSSRERNSIFEKIVVFSEIALIIDLVSEIRLPTYRKQRVNLSIVLDIAPLIELIGMSGKRAQEAMQSLYRMCKNKNIQVMTLSHIVDEMNEICYNALENASGVSSSFSINESMRTDSNVGEIVRKVHRAPDTAVRNCGVTILPYTSVGDSRSKEFFPDSWIEDFTDYLSYSKDKVMTRKRDAWSLAYAVRRQNGLHTSNAYESRCIILTRNPSYVSSVRDYLKCDEGGYPQYAVLPIMQVRQFSTMFLVSFGSSETEGIVRSNLVASCEEILRVSPALTDKIRDVLVKLDTLTSDQIDAALHDPAIIAEFALSTANDPAVISAENGMALLDVIRKSAAKDAELRFLAEKADLESEYNVKMSAQDDKIAEQAETISNLGIDVQKQAGDNEILRVSLEDQKSVSASIIVGNVESEVSSRWQFLLIIVVLIGGVSAADVIWRFTGLNTYYARALGVVLAVGVLYGFVSPFISWLAPHSIRSFLIKRSMKRKLKNVADIEIRDRVRTMLSLPPD